MGSQADRRGPGDRAGMTAARVLEDARALVEQDGIEALTMRRLADRLGVAPNTIYSHFADKSAIVDAVLDELVGDVPVPEIQSGDWRDRVVELMEASRSMLLRHPMLVPHLLSRPMRGRNASRLGEATLALLERGGVRGPEAVTALRALLTFTFGSVVLDAPRRQDPDLDAREAASAEAFGSQADLPRVSALAEPLARRPDESDFGTALRWLLDGIERNGTPR